MPLDFLIVANSSCDKEGEISFLCFSRLTQVEGATRKVCNLEITGLDLQTMLADLLLIIELPADVSWALKTDLAQLERSAKLLYSETF